MSTTDGWLKLNFASCVIHAHWARLDRFLWEQKVAKKVKVLWQLLVGNFGLYLVTLFVHARYGAMEVLCTGLVECGGVLVEN